MSTPQKRVVACISDGEPPKKISKDVETIKFTIYNFKDREQKRGEKIESPIATAHGYKWVLWVHPRGHTSSSKDADFISCFLVSRNNTRVSCKYSIRIGNTREIIMMHTFKEYGHESYSWGWGDFIKRDVAIESSLEQDGSLVVECDIQIAEERKHVWYPKKLQQQDHLVKLYDDASSGTSDVAFLVEETVYSAHKNILSLQVKKLYEISKEWENDGPIPIHSMRGNIFKSILEFVYTVKTPEIENEGVAKELIVAADCYECIHLKLYAESFIVDKFLKPENAAALLIFADSHSCALLKEAATNLFVIDTETVKSAEAWSEIKESARLLDELLDSLAHSIKPVETKQSNAIDQLSVRELRDELEDADMEMDGSREVLVARLKAHRQSQKKKKAKNHRKR